VDIAQAITSLALGPTSRRTLAALPAIQATQGSAEHLGAVVRFLAVVVDFAAEIEGHEARGHGWGCFGAKFVLGELGELRVRFFVRVIAVGHAFAADPAAYKRVGFAAAFCGGGVFDADASVEDDVYTSPPVLLDSELVLCEGTCSFVRGVGAVEREVEAMWSVEGRCRCRGRLTIL
jgi:hypothetical protein